MTDDSPSMARVHRAVGPVELPLPKGAVIAESEADLAKLLAGADGPREIWLRARTYKGDFKVTRTVTLRGQRGATLQGTGHGTVVEIAADHVHLDNVIVQHSGQRHTTEDAGIKAQGKAIKITRARVEDTLFGISMGPCPHCEIADTRIEGLGKDVLLKGDGIKLWESNDAIVRGCVVEGVRDVVAWYSRRVLFERNAVRHSRYGTHFMYAHDSIVRDSHFENNVVGIFVMYSSRLQVERNVLAGARGAAGVGVGFKESDGVAVRGNWLIANTLGTYLDETPRSEKAPVHFTANAFALNDIALRFHGVRTGLIFEGNDFQNNTLLADVEGGGDAKMVTFSHNYFSDYTGYDLDGDGLGDVSYQTKRLSGDMLDAHPSLRFFLGTTAMGLVDAVANALPIFASHVLIEDVAPRLRAEVLP